jgi:transcription factor MAFF/G/K
MVLPKPKLKEEGEGMNITDDALLKLSVKDLNRLLKSLSPEDRTKLKRRRRILKNRGYAANCRTKRLSQKELLHLEKEELEKDVRQMVHRNEMLKLNLDSINDKVKDLEQYASILKSTNSKMVK